MALIPMVGRRFTRMMVLDRAPNKGGQVMYRCRCDCGKETIVQGCGLRNGHTRSCGCLTELTSPRNAMTHGESRGENRSSEYNSWRAMQRRCYDASFRQYLDYGGRGISVCKRWAQSYVDFLGDMGRKPTKAHTIDRINVDGNYEPQNCRWATRKEQAANKRVPRSKGFASS